MATCGYGRLVMTVGADMKIIRVAFAMSLVLLDVGAFAR